MRTEAEERELQRLIAEQARDDTHRQPMEPGTSGYGILLDIVDDQGVISTRRAKRHQPQCPEHGAAELVFDPHQGTGVRCRACGREAKRLARATSAERRRKDRDRAFLYRHRKTKASTDALLEEAKRQGMIEE